jgi:hypothetical protein
MQAGPARPAGLARSVADWAHQRFALADLKSDQEGEMAPDSDVFGGPEPDEQETDLLSGQDPGEDEDELGGPEPDEEGTDVLSGSDPGEDEDEFGGPEPDEEGTDILRPR